MEKKVEDKRKISQELLWAKRLVEVADSAGLKDVEQSKADITMARDIVMSTFERQFDFSPVWDEAEWDDREPEYCVASLVQRFSYNEEFVADALFCVNSRIESMFWDACRALIDKHHKQEEAK